MLQKALTLEGMKQGVADSDFFLLILTDTPPLESGRPAASVSPVSLPMNETGFGADFFSHWGR